MAGSMRQRGDSRQLRVHAGRDPLNGRLDEGSPIGNQNPKSHVSATSNARSAAPSVRLPRRSRR